MEFIEWNDSYSVGNVLLDAHHRIFFRIIRNFSASEDKHNQDAMKKRIEFLVDYVAMHLDAEEALLREAAYPQLDQHKALHETFARKMRSAGDIFLKEPAALAADELLKTMQEWFVNHVLGEDRNYMPYLP